jgi:hypothetical protein
MQSEAPCIPQLCDADLKVDKSSLKPKSSTVSVVPVFVPLVLPLPASRAWCSLRNNIRGKEQSDLIVAPYCGDDDSKYTSNLTYGYRTLPGQRPPDIVDSVSVNTARHVLRVYIKALHPDRAKLLLLLLCSASDSSDDDSGDEAEATASSSLMPELSVLVNALSSAVGAQDELQIRRLLSRITSSATVIPTLQYKPLYAAPKHATASFSQESLPERAPVSRNAPFYRYKYPRPQYESSTSGLEPLYTIPHNPSVVQVSSALSALAGEAGDWGAPWSPRRLSRQSSFETDGESVFLSKSMSSDGVPSDWRDRVSGADISSPANRTGGRLHGGPPRDKVDMVVLGTGNEPSLRPVSYHREIGYMEKAMKSHSYEDSHDASRSFENYIIEDFRLLFCRR